MPAKVFERRRVRAAGRVLVPERVRRARLRTGRGRVRDRRSRMSGPVVPVRQHGGMVLLRVQPWLPERHHVPGGGDDGRERSERPHADVVARVEYNVSR